MPGRAGGAFAGKTIHRIVFWPGSLSAFFATTFAQDDAQTASTLWRGIADLLRRKLPKPGLLIDTAEHDVLAYIGRPTAHRTKLHSTNPFERLNGEVKRQTDVVGIFLNEGAITRLVGAILMEQSEQWAVQRARYITLETMAPVSVRQGIGPADQFLIFLTPTVMLSAVPSA